MLLQAAASWLLGIAGATGVAVTAATTPRQRVSLDGEWNFSLHAPAAAGALLGPVQTGTILVPGSWEAQGFGTQTVQMHHQVLTGDNARGQRGAVGVYTQSLKLPAPCPAAHRPVFMVDQGIHRRAIFKVGSQELGEHTGYLTPFEAVLTAATVEECCCGSECTVEVTLDGGRACDKGGCSDALMGAADDDTDGTGLGGWAGLNGHVSIECRPPVFIDKLSFEIEEPTGPGHSAAMASVTILDNSSGVPATVATSGPSTTPQGPGNVTLTVTVPQVKLWSPENRSLYTAVVTLYNTPTAAAAPSPTQRIDSATTRFGVRSIAVDGHKLMLNGQRVFLAGYGDDSIYPDTVSPPRTKAPYEEKLRFAHWHGFNFVRHHSHVLPPEYFDAADEWGIMVSPELPCVYGGYFAAANRTAQELYLASWASYIASYRNHPSVFTWTLCNEMYMGASFVKDGETFGAERFFAKKKALDPTDSRLMMDQDGACDASDVRESLSFCSHGFDVRNMGCIGYDRDRNCLGGDVPTKYHSTCNKTSGSCAFAAVPKIPVISHETGNYNTFPRIQSLIKQFEVSGTTIRPYWLSPAITKLNASGLLHEVDDWATASEKLYVNCWKLDIEDHRHNPQISGYEWWLIQDYWTGNNGIVDTFLRPKPGVAPYIAQFNARSILIQDGLGLSYVSGETLGVDISLSNFGVSDLPGDTKLTWQILLDGKIIKAINAGSIANTVPQGALGLITTIEYTLPDVGTSTSVAFGRTDGPKTLTVTAQLVGNQFSATVPTNSWNSTLFPRKVIEPSPPTKSGRPIQVTDAKLLLPHCGFSDCEASSIDPDPSAAPAVYLTATVTSTLIQSIKKGSVVVMLGGMISTSHFFKTDTTRFKQAWWLGSASDNNAGTLVYSNAATILGGMAPERYADQTWWRMINGAQTFLMDEMPTLPGSWSEAQKGKYGKKDGCKDRGQGGCPANFPFLTHEGAPFKGVICYKTQAEASRGEGPCGSWCTMNVNVGNGCGSNAGRLCAPTGSSCKLVSNVSACEALCDASPGCSAINYNASHGCCLESCGAANLGPPKSPAGGECCGYYRTTGEPMPRNMTVGMRAIDVVGLSRNKALLWSVPLGRGHIVATGLKLLDAKNASAIPYPEQQWILDRLLRYASSLI